jgi:hypothetical protein
MFIFVVGVATAFAISLVFYLHGRLSSIEKTPTILAFVCFTAAAELWCSLYSGYVIFISLYFLPTFGKNNSASKVASPYSDCPSLAIVYLCCDDIDQDCLESLCRTKTLGVRFSDQLYMKWFDLLSDCGQKEAKNLDFFSQN